MKRSKLNALIKDAIAFLDEINFKLPPLRIGLLGNNQRRGMRKVS